MTADERLLQTRKEIWSGQIHNLKAQIKALRDRIGQTPEQLIMPLVIHCDRLKECEKLLNEVEFSLDTDMRDAMHHMAMKAPDKCTT